MNPVKQIGRYEIPIASVVMVEKKTGFLAWLKPGYKVLLASGIVIHLTNQEKEELDKARTLHGEVMDVMHMVAGLQRNNRPVSA